MKKTFLLVAALAATSTLLAQDDLVIYGDVTSGIEWHNFAGPTNVQEVDNPTPDAVNSTAKCISMNRPKETGGSDEIGWPWEGALSESFSVPNITDYNSISMLVKKPYPGKVCLELQSPTGGSGMIYAEYTATDDSWQKLTFPIINVSGLGATGLTKILVEIHREDENNNDDFEDCIMYADEITLHKAMPEFSFNGEDKIAGGWIPFPGDEFSRKARIVANPDQTGINTTDKCLWIKREKNDEVFSGAINRNFKVNNLNEFRCMTMMVKKSIAGPVSLELQSPGEEKKQILTADYTEVGRWQKLEFVFPDNLLEGAPLQIIILQAHVVDTKEDASFTEPMDIYVDELYLSSETVSIPLYSKDKKEIVKTEIYGIRGMLMTTFGTNEEVVIDNLEKGVYVVRQTDKEGNVTVEKMMNR